MTSSYNNEHVYPVLKIYKNITLVLNINENIDKSSGGNRTPLRRERVVFKKHANLNSKHFDSVTINSVSEDNT